MGAPGLSARPSVDTNEGHITNCKSFIHHIHCMGVAGGLTLRVPMSSVRTTNSSRSRKIPSPPLSLSSSSLSPAMAASACFFARWREVRRWEAGASSGVGGDGGGEDDEDGEEEEGEEGDGCPASGSWS